MKGLGKTLTPLMCEVLLKVRDASREKRWWRAEGQGQRVTLASLHSHGLLERRAWRGKEGERDAAHEYRVRGATWTEEKTDG